MAQVRERRSSDSFLALVVGGLCGAILFFATGAWAASATLAWDPVPASSLAGYTVHWGTASRNYTSQVDAGNATSRTVTGLTEGATYFFAVSAYDTSGSSSGLSNEVSTTVPYTAPVANFSSSAVSGTAPFAVNFTSTSSGTITTYAWTFGDGTTSTAQNPVKTYFVAGTYTVTLTVTGPGGSNTKTNASYVTVSAPVDGTPPTAPGTLTATAGGSAGVNLTWAAATDNVGVTGYRVERCAGTSCANFAQVATAGGTSFSDSGLAASTTYRYRVRATDAAGNLGGYSPIASASTNATPDTTAPTAPGTLTATASGSTGVNLTWTAATDNVGVIGYRVERCQGTGCATFAQIAAPTNTSFSDSGLTAGTSYRYRVRAVDAAGNLGPYSTTATVATTAAAPVASFTATPVIGTAPLTVNFASTSTGSIATYAWSFGDGTTSSAQNPSKVYSTSGSFTVSLTVTGSGGSHTATQTNFIAVSAPNAALVLVGVLVDRTAAPGTVSNVNGILEPGETVLIAPMWELTAGGSVTVSASAQVSGQGSSAFALGDRAASYGSLTIGQVVDCESATGNCYRLTVSEGVRRPTLKWGINFTETLSTGTVVTRTIPIGKSFADVPTNDMFYAQIEAMAWNDVTYGYDDGTYKPGLGVSRWQTAMFLARASVKAEGIAAFPVSGIIGTKPYNCVAGGVSVYTDVSPTDPGCQAFHYLASRQTNLSSECGASTLVCPDRATTRAAMAVEVAGTIAAGGDAGIPAVATFNDTGTARSYNCATTGGSHFTDVPSSAGFCRHVNYLWARGIVDGYGGGIFHPEVSLTRGQMAKFVTNAFRLSME